jgi:two-component system, OmpR family, sensor kinase
MKIRHKITLWIATTVLVTAIAFSTFVFLELMKEPYKLIDAELEYMTSALTAQGLAILTNNQVFPPGVLPYPSERYWIKIIGLDGRILFASAMTRVVDLTPVNGRETAYNVEKTVPRQLIHLGQDEDDAVAFRVLSRPARLGDLLCTVQIAKPIEDLEEELDELLREVGAGLATCTLLGILASYLLAGRILRPVATISQLARHINEETLNQRIPAGESPDELNELIHTLNRMFDRLHHSFNRQKTSLADASHELKSPIALLMLRQEEMLQTPSLPEPLRNDLEQQLHSLRRMGHLVKTLLDLSRLEQRGIAARQPVDLAELVAEIVAEYREMFVARDISVQNDLPEKLLVPGDPERLRRLVINLIDNASRYNAPAQGHLTLKGWSADNQAHLQFANTGPGIPAADLTRVFEQFYRVEKSRSLDHGGSGLGLTIAKKIVDLHNGRISLTSDPGSLTTVTVSLPTE